MSFSLKKTLLKHAGGVALTVLFSTTAFAQSYSYTGSVQSWTVAATGTYTITAIGAQGGHGTIDGGSFVGGLGASITGSFDLLAGSVYYFAVGGMGTSLANSYNGGGGGGTFFVGAGGSPLLVAGGGGGIRAYAGQNGFDASITQFGVNGSGSNPTGTATVKTTGLGQGGGVSSGSYGSGGGGFYSNGAYDQGNGGSSWANGLTGGTSDSGWYGCASNGGFGGGGAGGCGGGGGGGGYSGGDGGFIAGGGGSFNTGYDQVNMAGIGNGDGSLQISLVSSVPEPETLAMMLVGMGLMGAVVRRRKAQQA
jgi:hypothetical protein